MAVAFHLWYDGDTTPANPPMDVRMKTRIRNAIVFDGVDGPAALDLDKFIYAIGSELKSGSDVVTLCLDGPRTHRGETPFRVARAVRTTLRAFDPDRVIYVPSPGSLLRTFVRGSAVCRCAPEASHAMVLLTPTSPTQVPARWLRSLCQSSMFVASYKSLLALSRLSIQGEVLPPGIDPEAYTRPSDDERRAVRNKYNVDENAFVFLVSPNAELDEGSLRALGLAGSAQVLGVNASRQAAAKSATDIRWLSELDNPHESYWLADCFVFPEGDSDDLVEFPSGVIESLSCGVPVLTKPVGGLRDFLTEGVDVRFWESPEELEACANAIQEGYPSTVRPVDGFSWRQVAARIDGQVS